MTKSQIDRLGKQLRATNEPTVETLSQLQEFRASFDEPMFNVQLLLSELRLKATSRLKTINTIIEKLRRERTSLSRMQDIAGLRIVSNVDLNGQDIIVSKVVNAIPDARVYNRRERPNHGYRAVHVIGLVDERRIEIQIRTQLQDLWAQAFERLADEVGREIRYGGAAQKRTGDVDRLLTLSSEIASIENVLTRINQLIGETQPSRLPFNQRTFRMHLIEVQNFRRSMIEEADSIRTTLKEMFEAGGLKA